MPQFDFPYPSRYNTLRLLGYDYSSPWQLCAISLVTDLRRPLFAEVTMAKSVLECLLSNQTLEHMRVRAFTLMPDHLHFLAGVREPENKTAESDWVIQKLHNTTVLETQPGNCRI